MEALNHPVTGGFPLSGAFPKNRPCCQSQALKPRPQGRCPHPPPHTPPQCPGRSTLRLHPPRAESEPRCPLHTRPSLANTPGLPKWFQSVSYPYGSRCTLPFTHVRALPTHPFPAGSKPGCAQNRERPGPPTPPRSVCLCSCLQDSLSGAHRVSPWGSAEEIAAQEMR